MSARVVPDFLPPEAAELPHSRFLLAHLARTPFATPLGARAIQTSHVQAGAGEPPVLLLHGFDSSVLEFFRLLPLLAERREIWAVDLLGFGFTERRADLPCGPAAIQTHLRCFWKAKIARPVVLVGASMGGAVALDFALAHPEAVAGLVLIDSAGFTAGPPVYRWLPAPFDSLAVEFWRVLKRQHPADGGTERERILREAWRCLALHTAQPGWHEAMLRFNRSGGYGHVGDRAHWVRRPTLILWGDADPMLPPTDAERFRRAISGSTLRWIARCGHSPHIEYPEIVADHLLRFA